MPAPAKAAALFLFLALSLPVRPGVAQVPPEWRTDDEATGQELQRDPSAVVHADGTWTAVWVDFRTGYPSLYARTYDAEDQPLRPGGPITDGAALFGMELTPYQLESPALASLPEGRVLVVWKEDRGGPDRILACVLEDDQRVLGPVWVHDDERIDTRSDPQVSVSGDRALVTWTEGALTLSTVYGQILALDLSPVGGNFRLHPEAGGVQLHARSAPSPSGWTVAWETTMNDLSQVYIRAVDRSGPPLGALTPVESAPDFDQHEPVIVAAGGGFFVCWTAGNLESVNLRANQRDAALAPVGEPFLVVEPGETITPREPEVLDAGDGRALVIWTAGPGTRPRFHARGVELPATPLGEFVLIEDPEDPEGTRLIPQGLAVAGNGPANLRALWFDPRDGWDLAYALRIDPSGTALGPAMPLEIDEGTASQVFPAVAFFPGGGGYVAWEDFRSGGLAIHGVLLDEDGRPAGTAARLSEMGQAAPPPSRRLRDLVRPRPEVATTSDGHAIIAWTSILTAGRSQIFMQVLDRSGASIGNNIQLPGPFGTVGQSIPSIATHPDGTFTIAWRDIGTDIGGDIFARRYLSDGTAESDQIISVVDAPYNQSAQNSPAAASSGAGEAVIVWLDQRQGNFDVFSQRIGPTGLKIGPNTQISAIEDDPVPQFNPSVAAAPDRYVAVWDDNPLGQGGITGLLVILPTAKEAGAAFEERIAFTIGTGSSGFKFPRVAMEHDGRFVVTYWDTSADSARVMAQRYDATATPIGVAYSIVSIGGRATAIPGDVAVTSQEILYAFADSRERRGWDALVRQVSWAFDGELTDVALSRWSVEDRPDGLIVRWSVPRARAGLSYRLWREVSDGSDPGPLPPRTARVIADPVLPLEPGGIEYEVLDAEAPLGPPLVYWIEDPSGEFAGPWVARRGAAFPLALRARGNPFTERVALAWTTPAAGKEIDLALHDAAGRLVRRAPAADLAGSAGVWIWDGRDAGGRRLPAGVYWARLAVPGAERALQLVHLGTGTGR